MADYIAHYASPYYDPVKAHEYYEEHKKLKGRHEGRTLTEEGVKAKMYVRKTINEKRDADLKALKEGYEKDREATTKEGEEIQKQVVSAYAKQTGQKIALLQEKIMGMTKAERKAKGRQLQREIDGLRADNKAKRVELTKQCREAVAAAKKELAEKYKSSKEGIRKGASDTYEAELDKIYNDSATSKATKSKASGSTVSYTVKDQAESRAAKRAAEEQTKKKK
jgi:hypothetical protein